MRFQPDQERLKMIGLNDEHGSDLTRAKMLRNRGG